MSVVGFVFPSNFILLRWSVASLANFSIPTVVLTLGFPSCSRIWLTMCRPNKLISLFWSAVKFQISTSRLSVVLVYVFLAILAFANCFNFSALADTSAWFLVLSWFARPSPVLFGSFSPINLARWFNAAAKSAPRLNLTSEKSYPWGAAPRSFNAFSFSANACFLAVNSSFNTAAFLVASASAFSASALAFSALVLAFSASALAFSASALAFSASALAFSAVVRDEAPFSKSCTFLAAASTAAFALLASDCFVATSLARESWVAFLAFTSASAVFTSAAALIASSLAFWIAAGVASFSFSAADFSALSAFLASKINTDLFFSFSVIAALVSNTFFSASWTCASVTVVLLSATGVVGLVSAASTLPSA